MFAAISHQGSLRLEGANSLVARALLVPLLLLVSLMSSGCGTSATTVDGGANLDEWSTGPSKWLIQPDELKPLRQIETSSESIVFLREFWARRDPDPHEAGNPFAEKFFIRVEAADQLYREGTTRGALTDRGRALILLGPPSRMRLFNQPSLAPDPRRVPGTRLNTREVTVEEWGYEHEDLDERLVAALEESTSRPVILRFLTGEDQIKLVEGEQFLVLASQAAASGEL